MAEEEEVPVVTGEVLDFPAKMPPIPLKPPRKRRQGTKRLPQNEKQLAAYKRAQDALRLKARGMSYRAIADALGYRSASSVHEAIHRLLDDYDVESDVAEYRRIEIERLDTYERQLMEIVAKGGKYAPRAIEVAMKLMERRAKLLGLDAAEQHEVSINAPTFYDYERDSRQDDHQRKVVSLLEGTGA